jgi:hypothetical protein
MKYRVAKAVTANGRHYEVGEKVEEPLTAGSFAESMARQGYFERADGSKPGRGAKIGKP